MDMSAIIENVENSDKWRATADEFNSVVERLGGTKEFGPGDDWSLAVVYIGALIVRKLEEA